MTPKSLISFAIDPDARAELEKRARSNERSVSHELRSALRAAGVGQQRHRFRFGDWARQALAQWHGDAGYVSPEMREELHRDVIHTLSSDTPGLIPDEQLDTIMEIIDDARPTIAAARQVELHSGTLTVPVIASRPDVIEQGEEKTEGGTINLEVDGEGTAAHTFTSGGNLAWQAVNWDPDLVDTWFRLAAASYAKRTEAFVGSVIGAYYSGTVAAPVTGSSNLAAWNAAITAAATSIYGVEGLPSLLVADSPHYLGLAAAAQGVGSFDLATGTGEFEGVRVVRNPGVTGAFIGDGSAVTVGEDRLRLIASSPSIAAVETGLGGAIAAKLSAPVRWVKLS